MNIANLTPKAIKKTSTTDKATTSSKGLSVRSSLKAGRPSDYAAY
jgi:hypothetical protein